MKTVNQKKPQNLEALCRGDQTDVGKSMYRLMEEMFPLCRSITGKGVRQTLQLIRKHIPIETYEIESGTEIYDWTVPKEWEIRDAYIKDERGNKIIDFSKSNLHVLNYSTSVNAKMTLEELRPHLHSLPDQPDVIPYLTSYYKENWGFCLTHNQLKTLKEGLYEVVIDSSLKKGSLTYSEYYLQGDSKDEVMFSCYTCHPSLCNDNLSGIALTTFLAKNLKGVKLKYSYRFLFIPETIGALVWLKRNEDKLNHIKAGMVVTCVGDPGKLSYQKTRDGNALIDTITLQMLEDTGKPFNIMDFAPTGSDERQFSSPGFNLPMGSLMRTQYGKFPQYHTSADNLDFVKPEFLADTYDKYMKVIYMLETNCKYLNQNPKGETRLGKRGLYRSIGSNTKTDSTEQAILWILNLSDGKHSLIDIAKRSKIRYQDIKAATDVLIEKNLLKIAQ